MRPLSPSGVHALSTMLAPGRATRASSAAAISWRGAKITPKHDVTRSNESSANGRSSASPSMNSISTPAFPARSRATSSSLGVMSRPVTAAPASAAASATLPLPVATSSSRSPGCAAVAATCAPALAIVREISG